LIVESRLEPFDMIATLTEFTARSIAENYRRHLRSRPDRVILGGGGAANPVLRAAIRRHLGVEVATTEELGWPLQAIEPAAFALLAYKRIRGEPGNIPETTGARRAVLLGHLSQTHA
jgi:anhydro-N-acetylmuramic acid kinase